MKFFIFELLYKDGISYIKIPFIKRRKELEKSINGKNICLQLTPQQVVDNEKELEKMFRWSINKNLEGILAKKFEGIYQPGARGWNWIKLKKSYSGKIIDTIDCLVMGYDFGKGKRTDFGIGAFLVGIYDEKNQVFVTLAKIGTGLSDKEWKELKIKSEKFKVKNMPKNYLVDKIMSCDVWLSSQIVVEIRADEITRSPVHTAGRKLKLSKTDQTQEVIEPGYALRFPRLERFRQDKNPVDVNEISGSVFR